MNRRLIGLLLALVLAGVATFLLVQYVNTADERAREGEQLTSVFIAQADIAAGTTAEDAAAQGLIAQDEIPSRTVPAGAIASLDSITGQVATGPLFEGEVIVAGRFGSTVTSAAGGATLDIPDGLHAVTVDAGILEGVAGFVRAGDTVSLVATIDALEDVEDAEQALAQVRAEFILQNVEVLAVGRRVPAEATEEGGEDQIRQDESRFVFTLALEAEDVETLLFAFQEGGIWFTLLPDGDQPEADTPGRTLENLFD